LADFLGDRIYDDFTVTDNDNNLVTGLKQSDFTYHLFNPSNNEVSSSMLIIKELGFGHYRVNFLPYKIGLWYLIIYHESYFPWGKAGNFDIKEKKKKRVKP